MREDGSTKRDDEITFHINDKIKLYLETYEPPCSGRLYLKQENETLTDASVLFENSEILKKLMKEPDCTAAVLISELYRLNITDLASEVESAMSHLAPRPGS
jgi:hypothetical protein